MRDKTRQELSECSRLVPYELGDTDETYEARRRSLYRALEDRRRAEEERTIQVKEEATGEVLLKAFEMCCRYWREVLHGLYGEEGTNALAMNRDGNVFSVDFWVGLVRRRKQ